MNFRFTEAPSVALSLFAASPASPVKAQSNRNAVAVRAKGRK